MPPAPPPFTIRLLAIDWRPNPAETSDGAAWYETQRASDGAYGYFRQPFHHASKCTNPERKCNSPDGRPVWAWTSGEHGTKAVTLEPSYRSNDVSIGVMAHFNLRNGTICLDADGTTPGLTII